MKKHLRIIIVDDHEVVRLGLRSLLERHPSFSVVDEAGTAKVLQQDSSFTSADQNKDGKLSKTEYDAAMKAQDRRGG